MSRSERTPSTWTLAQLAAILIASTSGCAPKCPTSAPKATSPSPAEIPWNEIELDLGQVTVPPGSYVHGWEDAPGHAMFWIVPRPGVLIVVTALAMRPGEIDDAAVVLKDYLDRRLSESLGRTFPTPEPRTDTATTVCTSLEVKERVYACATAKEKSVIIGFSISPKADVFEHVGGLRLIARLVSTSKSIAAGTFIPTRHAP